MANMPLIEVPGLSPAVLAAGIVVGGCGVTFPLVHQLIPQAHRASLKAAALFVFCLVSMTLVFPQRMYDWMNPFELKSQTWFMWYVLKCCGIALLDLLVEKVVLLSKPKLLEFRVQFPKVVGLPALEWIDFFYLSINSVIEFVFTSHVCYMILAANSPNVSYRWNELTILNTLPALWLIFIVDDFIYAFGHYTLHQKWLYPYIHKHHHRQTVPRRGYLDAGNEHPLEQIMGQGILYISLLFVARITGLHAVTILVHFVLYAALALLNHTKYDVRFTGFGFEYTVGAHELHHRQPDCNMAQYCMIWDRYVLGTFREYEPLPKKE